MIERFQGEQNQRKLIDTLKRQRVVGDDETLAVELCKRIKLIEINRGSIFISQDNCDDDLFLILSGRVSVQVHGREVAAPKAGDNVGEMAVIDPSARRSASVIALEPTVLGKISESAFSELAERFPRLWRQLAVQLGERVRERNNLIVQKNPRPVIFIGSSKESLNIVRAMESAFQHDDFLVRPWTSSGVFGASHFAIEDLERQVQTSDFAVLVLGPDDKVLSRDQVSDAPRDNVIFELGLFMGALTRQRTFIVLPRGIDIKVPSDLLGLKPLDYKLGSPDTLPERISPVCNALRLIIEGKGTK
ncbi:MAG TPA: TIR domain-containing protein [Blastocatellia bacterium]|nr:TIR domain-containing protein [Blastocatellia bacterium]